MATAKHKPLLTNKQMKNRMVWARAHKNWTLEEWGTVVWSDESRFEVSIGDTRSRVIRTKSEAFNTDCLRTKVKFPVSIMVWGSMSSSSVGRPYFADGGRKRGFQQDGAPCHSARMVKVCMTENGLETLP
ncbi:hypothetical protein ILUMI_23953 [Ignelater luminosus]|uniref:Transposase n=1 Tax=Ignelater luminosus TaxID=2038154 RepID=A0A8K0C759_IGNLU|nr:hypothetical protein ILUMI_23953 [Ignelater luminosus]